MEHPLTTRRAKRLGAGLALTLALAGTAEAQKAAPTYTCREADSKAVGLVASLTGIATGTSSTDAATRSRMQIPQATALQVSLVLDNRVCAEVGSAYNAALDQPSTANRSLYVVKVGTTYFAQDPLQRIGDYTTSMVLSSKFAVLSRMVN